MNLSDGIRLFLADRKAKGIAPGTIRNDKSVLEHLLADVGNLQLRSLRPQHMDAFWARRQGWAPGTLNKARYSLKTFVAWCQDRGYIKSTLDPLAGTRNLKVPPRKVVVIPQAEFSTFLEGVGDARTRAAVAIGLYLFTRISETQTLRWQDMDLVTDRPTVEVYRQKTHTLDTLPVCSELVEEMRRWRLAYAAEIGRPLEPRDFVIPGQVGGTFVGQPGKKGVLVQKTKAVYQPDRKANLSKSLRRALQDAGYYQLHEGGHTLRRSGAIALYNQLTTMGHDRAIRICQAMLGHANLQTTEIYLRLDLDRKVRNDLLAGQPMFPEVGEAEVVALEGKMKKL